MTRHVYACAGLTVCLLAATACSRKETTPVSPAERAARKVTALTLTRTVVLPARVMADPGATESYPAVLTFTEGGDDEPAEGPATFDVLADGGFAIADPLRQRIVFYDGAGKFLFDLLIHFAAGAIRVLPNNALSVLRATTGERYIYEFDSAGRYQSPRRATPADPDPDTTDAGTAKLESGELATVSATPGQGGQAGSLAVHFQAPGQNMVSVRRLGSDTRYRTYVAIETAMSGQEISVQKIIRKYNASGETMAETAEVPLDYYVHPDDEFRIREGVMYQLVPKGYEVRINVWDTRSVP